jgi:LysM repeat protein
VHHLGFLLLLALGLAPLGAQTPATHTVQKGETVYAIAKKYGTTVEAVLQANPGLNPARLHAGDKICLPPFPSSALAKVPPPSTSSPPPTATTTAPQTWLKIKQGDTLSKIARENSVKLEDLRRWNNLKSDTIRPGDLLRLRAPAPTAQSPPSQPAPTAPQKPAGPDWRFITPIRSRIEAPRNRLREWEYIVVHHSGTSGGNAAVFDAYHSRERGMENGMAYHFVIGNGTDSGDGQIEVGNRWRRQIQGGHLASETLNEIAIGICLVGDFSRHRLGPRQTAALIELVQYLRAMMPKNRLKFRLHREINTRPTECPGRLFPTQALREILNAPDAW